MQIVRRLGVPPKARGSLSGQNCPDVFELADGDFAVIGTDAGRQAPDRALDGNDRMVVVTRDTLVHAKTDIPLDTGTPIPRGGQQVKIERRLGTPPRLRRSAPSTNGGTCPDIFELSDGNFAVIGTPTPPAPTTSASSSSPGRP
jgi:hypothetical protein